MAKIDSIDTIPSTSSTDNQWIEWHKTLRREIGKANANSVFLEAWERRRIEGLLGSKANTGVLRSYAEDQGMEISADGALKYAMNTWDDVTGFFEGATKIGAYFTFFIILLILIPVVILAVNIARKPEILANAISPIR
jgi:hypothetical protein